MVILHFFTVFHPDLQKYSFHNNKTVLQLYKNVVDDSKWLRERDKKVRVGKSERPGRKKKFLLRQLDFFLFTVCLIRCPFMELPVVRRRERDTRLHKAEVFAVLLTARRGRVGGRQRDVKREM